jgi:hypothetical protein
MDADKNLVGTIVTSCTSGWRDEAPTQNDAEAEQLVAYQRVLCLQFVEAKYQLPWWLGQPCFTH